MDESERQVTQSEPAEPGALVARVNLRPEDSIEERYGLTDHLAPVVALRDVHGAWSVSALVLGMLALLVIVAALILILRGVFQTMPT